MMSKVDIRKDWNGKEAKNDPTREYTENLIYILYKENLLDCYFEDQRLVNNFLNHDHIEEIEEIRYHNNRPIAVKGYLPLTVLTISNKPRKEKYAKNVIPYNRG